MSLETAQESTDRPPDNQDSAEQEVELQPVQPGNEQRAQSENAGESEHSDQKGEDQGNEALDASHENLGHVAGEPIEPHFADVESSAGSPTGDMDDTEDIGRGEREKARTSQKKQSNERLDHEDSINAQKRQREERVENREWVQAMRALFGSNLPSTYIGHVTVGQDWYTGIPSSGQDEAYPPPQRDSSEVSRSELIKIRHVYQRHAAYSRMVEALIDARLIVLQGQLHVGKRAAALYLAQEIGDSGVLVRELSPEDELDQQMHLLPHHTGTIYLVDGLIKTAGQAIERREANIIQNALERNDCFMIICTQSTTPLPPSFKVIDLQPLSTPVQVLLEAHLIHYGVSDEDILTLGEHTDVIRVLENDLCPYQVDRLARLLADAVISGFEPEDALRGFMIAAESDVRSWFDETADNIQDSTFKIALAVMNGTPFDEIRVAANNLAGRLQWDEEPIENGQEVKETEKSIPKSPFTKKRADLLERARAHKVKRQVITDYSEFTDVEVVEFNDPAYAPALLKYVWTEFDDVRDALLGWLRYYAVDGDRSDYRVRAAGAIGALAIHDFPYLQRHVFRLWARGDNEDKNRRRRTYQALGNALGAVILDDIHAEDVLGLLRLWTDSNKRELQWAASRAYAPVGLRYPREALNQWQKVLRSTETLQLIVKPSLTLSLVHSVDVPLQMSVIDSIFSLFYRAVEFPHRLRPVYEHALEGLANWIQSDKRNQLSTKVGLALFISITAIHLPPEDSSSDEEDWTPAMLHIVGTQPDSNYRRILAYLLRDALRDGDFGIAAAEALHQWVQCADRNEWIKMALTALLQEMLSLPGTAPRDQGRLRMYLTRWGNDPRHPLIAALSLKSELELM